MSYEDAPKYKIEVLKTNSSARILYSSSTNDENYTPQYAVLPIIKYLPKDKIIWCPFDTENSEFVLNLKEYGYDVVYSHIITGKDFYEYEPPNWDIIVSNPPFTNKRRIFERALGFKKPFALLMSNTWLNDAAPKQLFMEKDLELLMFDKRIQYNDCQKITFSSSYFCVGILQKQIIMERLSVVKGQTSRIYKDFV